MKTIQLWPLVVAVVAVLSGRAQPEPQNGSSVRPAAGITRVEGTLLRSIAVATEGVAKEHEPSRHSGQPIGLKTEDGFCMLLVDGRLLDDLADKRARARASGIVHDSGRSLTPFRIELFEQGRWVTFDLPHSGVSGSGVVGGDE